jgi:hypothetical protein
MISFLNKQKAFLRSIALIGIFFINQNIINAQSVKLISDPGFIEYSIFYLNSINLKNGSIQSRIFRFVLHSDSYTNPLFVKVLSRITFHNPDIGIYGNKILIEFESAPFEMKADLALDSKDMSVNTTQLLDFKGNIIPIKYSVNEKVQQEIFGNITGKGGSKFQFQNSVTTGKLFDGTYTFLVEVYSGSNPNDLTLTDSESYSTVIESASYINLESPGGELSDTTLTEVYTTFPLFVWYPPISCLNCESEIRISQYIPNRHSSVEDAINDELLIPSNNEEWEIVGNISSFQYPISQVRPLHPNSVYVWQVRTKLLSTQGDEYISSPIWAYKIGLYADSYFDHEQKHPLLDIIRKAITEEKYKLYFGQNAYLEEFIPTGNFMINGELKEESDIVFYLNRVINKKDLIVNISVKE